MRWGSVARVCQDVILNVALSGEERLSQGPGLCTAFKVALSRPLLFGGFALDFRGMLMLWVIL